LERLTLIGLAFAAADAHHLTAFLQAGPCSSLTSLVLGDQQGLNFLSDKALEGLGRLLNPAGKLRVLDLSGCIELTDAGGIPASEQSISCAQQQVIDVCMGKCKCLAVLGSTFACCCSSDAIC
jgi:hypothetical protein